MKDIKSYNAPKYSGANYTTVEDGIFKNAEGDFVTSLSFVQELEFGEGGNAAEISQYPLEELLDEFGCWVSDFYEDLNTEDSTVCYQEFASGTPEEIKNLRSIIDKHVYMKSSESFVKLCIE